MTTTCMRNSIITDNWIYEATQANPVQPVLNESGQPTGNILTGPVRLMFCDGLLVAKPGNRQKPESPENKLKHSATILFNPWSDLTLLMAALKAVEAAEFGQFLAAGMDPATGFAYGLDNPFFDQGSKAAKYEGFTPGLKASNLSSNFKPSVVDARMNPVVDASKVYPGVWAILSVNAYASGKNSQRKGPRLGIQSVMLIADDTNCGGGGQANAAQEFRGTTVKAPTVSPNAAFGQPVAAPPATGGYAPAPAVAAPPPSAPPAPPASDAFDMSQFG